MGIFSKLISKDEDETDEEKKKKKEEEDEIVHVEVGGEKIPIAKGDMSNDEWDAIVKASKADVQPKSGDSIVVKGPDGSDLVIPKGDIDDEAWSQIKKNAETRGDLVVGDKRDQARASDIESIPSRRGSDVGRAYATDREEEDEDAITRAREGINDVESLPARRGGDVGRTYATDREEEDLNPRGRLEIGEPEIGSSKNRRNPRGRLEIGDAEFGPRYKEYKSHNMAERMAQDMITGGTKLDPAREKYVVKTPGVDREKYVERKIQEYQDETGDQPDKRRIDKMYQSYDRRVEEGKSKEKAFKKSVRDEEASIEGEGRSHNPAVRMAQEMALGATEDLPDRRGSDVGTAQPTSDVENARSAGIEYGPAIKDGVKQGLGPLYTMGDNVVKGGQLAMDGIRKLPGLAEQAGAFAQGVFDPSGAAQTNQQAAMAKEPFVGPPPSANPSLGQPSGSPSPMGASTAAPWAPGAPTSMSGSNSVSIRGKPGMAEIPMPKDRSGDIESAYGDAQRAMRANADLEMQGLKAKGQAFDAQVNEGIRQKAKLADIEEKKRVEVEKATGVYNHFASQLMQPSEKIDPNRWVNSRSTGQKVLLVLGAMFTKGGNVDMIRKAIDADIDQQKADIANKRQQTQMGLQSGQNLIQMARDKGADEVQASKIAYAVECDIAANRLQMIAANTDSQEVKQKAEQGIAEMNVQKSKALTDMDRYSTDLAIRKAQVQNQYDEVQIKRSEAWRKAHAPPKQGKGPEKIKGQQLEHIANLQTQLKELGKLRADYVSKYGEGGYGTAAYNSVTGLAPTSDASRFNRKGKSIQLSVLAAAQNAGVIQPGEYKRFEQEIATASSPDALNQLDNFIDQISSRLETTLSAFKAGGYSTEGQFSGEAPKTFEADAEESEE